MNSKKLYIPSLFFRAALLCLFIFYPDIDYAQTSEVKEGIGPMLSEAASQYINPVMPAFNASMNSGWFQSIPARKNQTFTLEFGLAAAGTRIGLSDKDINILGRYYFSQNQAEEFTESIDNYPEIRSQVITKLINEGVPISMNGSNILGRNKIITIHYGEDDRVDYAIYHEDYNFPVYVSLEAEPTEIEAGGVLAGFRYLPAAFPQLKLGTLYSTQLILRGSPPIKIHEDIGNFGFIGIGLMHNPLSWLPETRPFQAALGGMWQGYNLGDYVDLKTLSLAGMGGYQYDRNWIKITPQLGFVADKSTLEFNYDETIDVPGGEDEISVHMSMEQDMAVRTFIGLHLYMYHVNLYSRYFMTGKRGFAGGLALSF